MRHRKAGVKLNRTASHRSAMFRNMVTSLLKHEHIQTTDAKAKEVRRWADHIITLAKRGDLHARRQALSILREKDVVYKIFEMADERFGSLSGGYTRVIKIGRRRGDAAPVSIVELVGPHADKNGKSAKKKKRALESKASAAPATAEVETAEPPAADTAAGGESLVKAGTSEEQSEASDEEAEKVPSQATAEDVPPAAPVDDPVGSTADAATGTDEPSAADTADEKPDTGK